VIVAE